MNARPRKRRNPVLEVPVPPECRQMIRQGALVSISTSGGKDSQAMTILLARIIPRNHLVAVHAPLGEVEWPGPSTTSWRRSPKACRSSGRPSPPARPCSIASKSRTASGVTAPASDSGVRATSVGRIGAQMRYAVHDRNGWPLAMLGFSTAAWKLAPRDTFIGWTRQLREKNLPFVVDNPRFLILPWVKIPNLGSHILAIIRRRLPDDWTERYNTTPVLIETFVETPRYTGAVYRASGWIHVGATQGRGRYDRDRQFDKPKKDVWLRPLRRDWKRSLNR